jgi:MFS family permease
MESSFMEALGLDSRAAFFQIALAVMAVLVIFFILSPIGGYFLHKFLRKKIPHQDTFALMAGAFVVFIVTSGLTLASILNLTEQTEATFFGALAVSVLVGVAATALSVLFVVRLIERGKQKINLEEQIFSVWEEDKRDKPKNLRKRR